MKYQVLFSLKNNEKVFINVVVIGALWVNGKKEFAFMGSFVLACLYKCTEVSE